MVPRRSLVLGRPCDRTSTSDRARDDPVRSTLRRFSPRRQPAHIAAACSPPAVHRVLPSLSRRGSASFRTDRGPWAARSAPSPSSATFRWLPADGPEGFPLGCLRHLAPSGCPGARGRRQSVRVDSARSARPRGSARVERVDPHSGSPRGDDHRSNHFEAASGGGALLLPLPPHGGRVAGVSAALRSLGAPLDLRSLGAFLAVRARGTEYSVFDGAPGRRGSSRSLAAPVAPSPSVTSALRMSPADFRVLLHRRVQSNPGVCCNFRVLCSFLGFVSPPGLSPAIA